MGGRLKGRRAPKVKKRTHAEALPVNLGPVISNAAKKRIEKQVADAGEWGYLTAWSGQLTTSRPCYLRLSVLLDHLLPSFFCCPRPFFTPVYVLPSLHLLPSTVCDPRPFVTLDRLLPFAPFVTLVHS